MNEVLDGGDPPKFTFAHAHHSPQSLVITTPSSGLLPSASNTIPHGFIVPGGAFQSQRGL